jgi:hypothetical protein
MRLAALPAALALAALFAFGPSTDEARAAPEDGRAQPVDLELKAAPVGEVLKLLGEIGKREIVADPCVRGAVDLKLKNVPIALVYDALAAKLGLVYDDDGRAIHVHCASAGAPAAAILATRVSLAEDAAPLPAALDHLAATARLDGVDYRAKARPGISVKLEGVRLATALAALADATGLRLTVVDRKIVAAD